MTGVIESMGRRSLAAIGLFLCIFAFAGCTGKGIQGTWELYEEVESDGNKVKKAELDDIGVNEIYEINGDTVHYKGTVPGLSKEIEFDMTLTDKGDNKYEFYLFDDLLFASVEVKGDYMTYYTGVDGDNTKMTFKRVK